MTMPRYRITVYKSPWYRRILDPYGCTVRVGLERWDGRRQRYVPETNVTARDVVDE
jgi:hypothetical protein